MRNALGVINAIEVPVKPGLSVTCLPDRPAVREVTENETTSLLT
jgi:hypothetical protein